MVDPTSAKRGLLPVRVRPCELPNLLASIVYIDLVGDQYYLFNVRHPGVRIAVNVVP